MSISSSVWRIVSVTRFTRCCLSLESVPNQSLLRVHFNRSKLKKQAAWPDVCSLMEFCNLKARGGQVSDRYSALLIISRCCLSDESERWSSQVCDCRETPASPVPCWSYVWRNMCSLERENRKTRRRQSCSQQCFMIWKRMLWPLKRRVQPNT